MSTTIRPEHPMAQPWQDPPRRLPPLQADHPEIGKVCPGCDQPFVAGDVLTFVVIGPGDDIERRQRARDGEAYNAVALTAHYACVTGIEE